MNPWYFFVRWLKNWRVRSKVTKISWMTLESFENLIVILCILADDIFHWENVSLYRIFFVDLSARSGRNLYDGTCIAPEGWMIFSWMLCTWSYTFLVLALYICTRQFFSKKRSSAFLIVPSWTFYLDTITIISYISRRTINNKKIK